MRTDYILRNNLYDPIWRAWMRNERALRSYQAETLRTVYDASVSGRGGRYTVTFPRQSGKNETQAQLESALMAASQYRGGNIIKIMPTEKNQGAVSRTRLEKILRGGSDETGNDITASKDGITYGNTRVRCLSASPNAAIVGATADLLLEVDEAQLVPAEKFDREAAPMAASTNAVRIFWGTAWDDRTLLSREVRLACRDEETDGKRHIFLTNAAEVGKEVPAYAEFVRQQIEGLGREHPAIRTQFFCEEISDLTGMFTPERLNLMRGTHLPLTDPEPERCYVFLIDIAGSDEMTAGSRQNFGFSDRRDATVLTICDVFLPDETSEEEQSPIWHVVGRRYYRNVPAVQLEKLVSREVDHWNPARIVLDHTGLGCMLSEYLDRRYPRICSAWDITAGNKSRMAWEFLAMVNTGRWQEYAVDELDPATESGFDPRRDPQEVISDPALLQRMFFRELRACRLEPAANAQNVHWGVPDGTRDPANGRLIHDDLVMSAALSVLGQDDLPLFTKMPIWDPPAVIDPMTGRPFPRNFWKMY